MRNYEKSNLLFIAQSPYPEGGKFSESVGDECDEKLKSKLGGCSIMKLTGLFSWQTICQKTKLGIILIIGISGFVSVALPAISILLGDVSGDGAITEDDARLMLQEVVDKITLTPIQQAVADVSGNGVITAYDAELILQYAAGIVHEFPAEPAVAGACELPNVTLSISEGLTAMPHAKGVEVPVMISDVTGFGIVALQFDVVYDTNVLTISEVTLNGAITEADWGFEFNPDMDSQGLVKVAMVGDVVGTEKPKGLTGSGVIAKIIFDVDSGNPNDCSGLNLENVLLNEDAFDITIGNGRICCTTPPDFNLTVEPNTITLPIGGSASLTVTIEWIGGFTGDVELSVEGLPNGVTASEQGARVMEMNAPNDGYPKLSQLSVNQDNQTLDVTIILTAHTNAQPGTTENVFVKGTVAIDSNTVVHESPPITLIVEPGGPVVFASGFYRPNGIAFDEVGNLYVANGATGEILRVFASGGEPIAFATGFSVGAFSGGPTGLAFDSDGTLFVADNTTGNLWSVAQDGVATPFVGGLNAPRHIAIDSTNSIYVANSDGRIIRVTPAGALDVFATLPSGTPFGLAFSHSGMLFVSNFETGRIFTIDENGTVNLFAELEPFAEGLCCDTSGYLYIGNGYKNKITKVHPDGSTTTFLENGSLIAGPVSLAIRDNFLFAASNFRTDVYRIPSPPLLYGDVNGDGMITPFDASLILQAVVGMTELSAEQRLKADVTGNDRITSYDAALVLQFTAGLLNVFPVLNLCTLESGRFRRLKAKG